MFWKSKKDYSPLDTRWVYTKDLLESEKEIHQFFTEKIKAWWKAFEQNEPAISAYFGGNPSFDIPAFMERYLNTIHPALCWEFGPALSGEGHRLVITPESAKYLGPLINEIVAQAPKVRNWEFYRARLPETFELAQQTVESRTGGTLENLNFQISLNEQNVIDLHFIRESDQTPEDYNQTFNDAFVGIENILGEENLDKWIGMIDAENFAKEALEIFPMKDLHDMFYKKYHEIQYHQPEDYFFHDIEDATWAIYNITPEKQDDYLLQNDLIVATTMNTALWQSTHSGNIFYSERFSKLGEIFCYLKVDGSQHEEENKFEDRSEIEDALNEALVSAKAGVAIGGGTGLKYSYINLAMADMNKGIEIIKNTLRAGNVTRHCWVMFFDTELENEWVGIWDDSPKPFLPNFKNKN